MTVPNFFSDHSPYLRHPLLTAERTAREAAFAASVLRLEPGARVLDVGCGFGRHSLVLAERGYQVVGIDPAAAMIAAARRRALVAGTAVDFRQVDMDSLTVVEPFAAAICLLTTLGQVSAHGDNSAGLLARLRQVLVPGGAALLEVPQRAPAVASLRASECFGGGAAYTAVARHFEPADNTLTETFDVVSPGSRRRFLLRYRLFAASELRRLVEASGFTVTAAYAGYDGRSLTPESPTMLFLLGRP